MKHSNSRSDSGGRIMKRSIRGLALLAAAFAAAAPAGAQEMERKAKGAKIGEKIADIKLKDVDGKEFCLADFLQEQEKKDEKERVKAIVVTFWSYDCGISKKYEGRIKAFADKLKDNKAVLVLGVNSNSTETAEKSKAYLGEVKTDLRVLLDPDGAVARALDAKCNTTSLVLDAKGALQYWGSIDNDKDAGQEGRKAYLEDAVAALLEGKEIAEKKTKAFG